MLDNISVWLLVPEVWVITGILLIVIEVVLSAAYFSLALGTSSLLMALTLYVQEKASLTLLGDWIDVTLAYAILSVTAVVLLKIFVQDKATTNDINEY